MKQERMSFRQVKPFYRYQELNLHFLLHFHLLPIPKIITSEGPLMGTTIELIFSVVGSADGGTGITTAGIIFSVTLYIYIYIHILNIIDAEDFQYNFSVLNISWSWAMTLAGSIKKPRRFQTIDDERFPLLCGKLLFFIYIFNPVGCVTI